MSFNYIISPLFTLEGALDMVMDFYCKFITEDSDDHWGIVLYDPGTDNFLAHEWTAPSPWQLLPYETYGYHKTWMGPMQPLGKYKCFNIKTAYENWYQLGYFRDGNGSRSYEFRIGFVFYESDSSGVVNAVAESNGEYWSGLFIDDISITKYITNDPPNIPASPSGFNSGTVGISYDYITQTTDPNGDDVKYYFDWGDGSGDWTVFVVSGSSISASHSWNVAGTFSVKVKAEDSHGSQSDFSPITTVIISENRPPVTPSRPVGPSSGKAGVSYSYSVSTTDPDGNNLYYLVDWGDGSESGWLGPFETGEECQASHIWTTKGDNQIKVKAKDVHGVESEWSDPLLVSMPKYKLYLHRLFITFLEQLYVQLQ
jgi:hypothetical protein